MELQDKTTSYSCLIESEKLFLPSSLESHFTVRGKNMQKEITDGKKSVQEIIDIILKYAIG